MEPSVSCNAKYERLMEEIGDFGKFQKRLCLLLVVSTIPNGYFALVLVFVGRTPPHRCFIPGVDDYSAPGVTTTLGSNVTISSTTSTTPLYSTQYIASEVSSQHIQDLKDDSCHIPDDVLANYSSNVTSGMSSDCPYGVIYDIEEGRTSIVTEWDLVCDRSWILPLITTIYMTGVLVGSLLSGIAADRFGRYPTFMTGTLLMFVFLGLCGVSTSPAMFCASLFLAGAFGFVNYVTAFIISAEMINSKDRVVTGTLTVGGFAGGYMLLPLFAYHIANWRILCPVLAALGVVFIPYIWLMTESPRWLFSTGRKGDFVKLFMKIAKVNGVSDERAKSLVGEFYAEKGTTEETLLHNDVACIIQKATATPKQFSYFDLVRIGVVRSRALCMWLTWFACSVVYYGVALSTSNMGGNPYINCFVAAAVEIPAYAMVIALLKWRGRKPILISTLLVAGLTCSAVPYLKHINNELAITFAMIGKLAVSASFSVVYIVSSELFPTLMRSMGVGSSSMSARVGGMVAPYLLYLGDSIESAPYLIIGGFAVVASMCNTLLPETSNTAMPETTEDLTPLTCFSWLKPTRMKKQKHANSFC